MDPRPTSSSTLAIIMGASSWPKHPGFEEAASFRNSAQAFRGYLLSENGLRLSAENLLYLFDEDAEAPVLLDKISDFLTARKKALDAAGRPARDLIVYYVGHGGFGQHQQFFLAIRATREKRAPASSLTATSLSEVLCEDARLLRKYLIIDSCFAAAIHREFQAQAPITVARTQLAEKMAAFGTGLLCASGPRNPAKAPVGREYTMFTGALLDVLTNGSELASPVLSLEELRGLVASKIDTQFGKDGVAPEVHAPQQFEGRPVVTVPLFPNCAKRATSLVSSAVHPSIDDDRTSASGLLRKAEACAKAWQFQQARTYYAEAARTAAADEDAELELAVVLEHAELERRQQYYDRAGLLLRRGRELLSKTSNVRLKALVSRFAADLDGDCGRFSDAISNYKRAESEFELAHDRVGAAHAKLGLAQLRRRSRDTKELGALLKSAMKTLEEERDPEGLAEGLLGLGRMEEAFGDLTSAKRHFGNARRLFEECASPLGKARSLKALGDIEMLQDQPEAAEKHFHKALRIFRSAQDRRSQAQVRRALGDVALRAGRTAEAEREYQESKRLFEEIYDFEGIAATCEALGVIAMNEDDHVAASLAFGRALTIYEPDNQLGIARVHANLADLAALSRNYRKARGHLEEARKVYKEVGRLRDFAYVTVRLGDLECSAKDYIAARGHYQLAFDLSRKDGHALGIGNALHGLGEVERLSGAVTEARRHFRDAIEQHEKAAYPLGLANAHMSLALTFEKTSRTEALKHFAEASHRFAAAGLVRQRDEARARQERLLKTG